MPTPKAPATAPPPVAPDSSRARPEAAASAHRADCSNGMAIDTAVPSVVASSRRDSAVASTRSARAHSTSLRGGDHLQHGKGGRPDVVAATEGVPRG